MYQAILFDMDGVLIETRQSVTQFWTQLAHSHQIELTPADFDRHIYGCPPQHTLNILFGQLSTAEHQTILADLPRLEPTWPVHTIPGVIDFLHNLQRLAVPTALVTSAARERVTQVLNDLQLAGLLRVVISREDITHGKPHPEGYVTAAQRLRVRPETCVVFEDSLSGTTAGVKAGAMCIGVQTGAMANQLRQIGAQHIIPDFCETQMERRPDDTYFLQVNSAQIPFGSRQTYPLSE